MTQPQLMLGGIAIVQQAGALDLTEDVIGGDALLRLSGGPAVKMTRYERMAGTISGQGWLPPGLDGLDYSQPLELRSTQVSAIQGPGPTFTLPSTPRPDKEPWAYAVLGGELVPAACSTVDGVVTVSPVAGASAYQVWWLPVYSVFARRPPRQQSNSTATQGWSIVWEEA